MILAELTNSVDIALILKMYTMIFVKFQYLIINFHQKSVHFLYDLDVQIILYNFQILTSKKS